MAISFSFEDSPLKMFPYITNPTALFKYFINTSVPGLLNKDSSVFLFAGANFNNF